VSSEFRSRLRSAVAPFLLSAKRYSVTKR
jgi:hypothetical protein